MAPPDDAAEFARWQQAYRRERDAPEPGVFELGLCMAGAISGGAYTAGVLDFLIEALDQMERCRPGPGRLHQMHLPVAGGASAGGMCSAIATAFLDRYFPPIGPQASEDDKSRNPLYRAWVAEIDIRRLLGAGDGAQPASLLDSSVLDAIVASVLALRGQLPQARRPWLVSPFRSLLTLGNLRGVPYGLRFDNTGIRHWMVQHADHARLLLVADPAVGAAPGDRPGPDEHPIDLASEAGRARFTALALATGAFPAALLARSITPPRADYAYRAMLTPACPTANNTLPRWAALLRPAWPDADPGYQAVCVDGGTMNNEPIDLVHRALAGFAGANPADPVRANRALVMIDPFVLRDPAAGITEQGMLAPLIDLFGALVQNSRFKPEELAMAADSAIASRMLISPSRGDDLAGEHAMAAGYLGGFMGFLARAYREHDFALGRRNCQGFLLNHFRLPATNTRLFGGAGDRPGWTAEDRQRFGRADGTLPLIPLCGSAATTQELPDWPRGALEPEELRDLVRARARRVVPALIDELSAALQCGGATSWALRQAHWLVVRAVTNKAISRIAAALEKLDHAN